MYSTIWNPARLCIQLFNLSASFVSPSFSPLYSTTHILKVTVQKTAISKHATPPVWQVVETLKYWPDIYPALITLCSTELMGNTIAYIAKLGYPLKPYRPLSNPVFNSALYSAILRLMSTLFLLTNKYFQQTGTLSPSIGCAWKAPPPFHNLGLS